MSKVEKSQNNIYLFADNSLQLIAYGYRFFLGYNEYVMILEILKTRGIMNAAFSGGGVMQSLVKIYTHTLCFLYNQA